MAKNNNKIISGLLSLTFIGSYFSYNTENISQVHCFEWNEDSVVSSDEYSDAVQAPDKNKNQSCALKDADAAVINNDTDFTAVDADTFIIMKATEEMNQMILELFQSILGADRSDRDAIFDSVSVLSSEQLSAAFKSSSATTGALQKISALKKSVVQDVKTVLTALDQSGLEGNIVISNVYNPFGNMQGGSITLAKASLQVYVDDINAQLSQLASAEGAVIADVSVSDTSEHSISGLSGVQAADTLRTIFDEQHASITDKINNTVVPSSSVEYTYGDINNDGTVDAADLTIMLRYQLSYDHQKNCPDDESITDKGYSFKSGDVCKDGILCDVNDLTVLKRYILDDIDQSVLGKVIF